MLAKGDWSPGPSYKSYIQSPEIAGPAIKDTKKNLDRTQAQRFSELFNQQPTLANQGNLKFHKKTLSGSCVDISSNAKFIKKNSASVSQGATSNVDKFS